MMKNLICLFALLTSLSALADLCVPTEDYFGYNITTIDQNVPEQSAKKTYYTEFNDLDEAIHSIRTLGGYDFCTSMSLECSINVVEVPVEQRVSLQLKIQGVVEVNGARHIITMTRGKPVSARGEQMLEQQLDNLKQRNICI